MILKVLKDLVFFVFVFFFKNVVSPFVSQQWQSKQMGRGVLWQTAPLLTQPLLSLYNRLSPQDLPAQDSPGKVTIRINTLRLYTTFGNAHSYTLTSGVQFEFSFNGSKKRVFLFLSFLYLPRIDIQALELWKEVRKGKGKEKTQEDCCGYPTACSNGTGYVFLYMSYFVSCHKIYIYI